MAINIIVVVGAGVSGLTSALLLSKNPSNAVTIVAKDMPGDYAADYASPWAGALFVPQDGLRPSQWECRTWPVLKDLAATVPEAGIHFQKLKLQRKNEKSASGFSGVFVPDPWFRTLFDDFSELGQGELAQGYDAGYAFTSVCINPAIYLPWLVGQCVKRGVVLRRGSLSHISQAQHLSHTAEPAGFVVNCTGLGSLKLGGVNDLSMAPARGQVVVVRNKAPSMLMFSSTNDDDDKPGDNMYVMERALGGGTVLGGTYQLGNWDPNPDPNTAVRIMKRAVDTCPELADGRGIKGLSVIRHGVGFRPFRQDGVRIEKQRQEDGTWILHNYGHDSWGYLTSYGCAERVVELFEEAINLEANGKSKARFSGTRAILHDHCWAYGRFRRKRIPELTMVLSFILIQNRQGKTRLAKWYQPYSDDEKIRLKGEVHRLIAPRDQKHQSNFNLSSTKIVYRRYAGLFFCVCVDANDNELAYLEAIHFFVEVLDQFFGNVCELDLVFNFYKVYAILDEVFLAGEIEETSKQVVLTRLEHLDKLE
ncbi:hypothetical protein DV735_g4717, partial [Chaetothyriales sp. CBS 134920]